MLVLLLFEESTSESNEERGKKESHYCYANDPDPYFYFSSKTPYSAVFKESKFEPPPGIDLYFTFFFFFFAFLCFRF